MKATASLLLTKGSSSVLLCPLTQSVSQSLRHGHQSNIASASDQKEQLSATAFSDSVGLAELEAQHPEQQRLSVLWGGGASFNIVESYTRLRVAT